MDRVAQLDDEVLGWLREAWTMAMDGSRNKGTARATQRLSSKVLAECGQSRQDNLEGRLRQLPLASLAPVAVIGWMLP